MAWHYILRIHKKTIKWIIASVGIVPNCWSVEISSSFVGGVFHICLETGFQWEKCQSVKTMWKMWTTATGFQCCSWFSLWRVNVPPLAPLAGWEVLTDHCIALPWFVPDHHRLVLNAQSYKYRRDNDNNNTEMFLF